MSQDLETELAAALEPLSEPFEIIDQETLPADDVRRGYPTPTILVRGADLFGLPEPEPPFPAPT